MWQVLGNVIVYVLATLKNHGDMKRAETLVWRSEIRLLGEIYPSDFRSVEVYQIGASVK